jgi:RNA polymerase sigma-70 factor, ECF subfamily
LIEAMTEADVTELYSRYGYFLFRRCLAYVGEEAAAQDAVQEVFVKALRGAARFRGEADPRTWLCSIADHHCLDVLRRRRRSPIAPGESALAADIIQDDDPAAIVMARRLMATLDRGSRRLACLYYLDELTQEEIARELGLSRRTIGKRLRGLSARLRALAGAKEIA